MSPNEPVQDVVDLVEVVGVEASGAMRRTVTCDAKSIEWPKIVVFCNELSHE